MKMITITIPPVRLEYYAGIYPCFECPLCLEDADDDSTFYCQHPSRGIKCPCYSMPELFSKCPCKDTVKEV